MGEGMLILFRNITSTIKAIVILIYAIFPLALLLKREINIYMKK